MNFQNVINGISNRAHKYLNERRGWKTDRRIVVIESDDWGSIRTPNREIYEKSIQKGIFLNKSSFGKNDTLASNEDFEALYNVLRKHKDSAGNHPVITANTIVANPDFEKIKESKFQEYYFEIFTETLKKYPNRSFKLWQQGIDEKLFYPQLHGREHLNVMRWLKTLRSGSKSALFAFEHNYFGISELVSEGVPNFLPALDYDDDESRIFGNQAVAQSADIFKEIFGFASQSFIAPNYYWHDETEKVLAEKNINYIQGVYTQRLPNEKYNYHYLGERSKHNQIYLTRNVIFEPATSIERGWVSTALLEIERAIKLQKPAIISMHRVNFIGSIFEENRTKNLHLLDQLLHEIVKRWPETEFMHSAELGELIEKELK